MSEPATAWGGSRRGSGRKQGWPNLAKLDGRVVRKARDEARERGSTTIDVLREWGELPPNRIACTRRDVLMAVYEHKRKHA